MLTKTSRTPSPNQQESPIKGEAPVSPGRGTNKAKAMVDSLFESS